MSTTDPIVEEIASLDGLQGRIPVSELSLNIPFMCVQGPLLRYLLLDSRHTVYCLLYFCAHAPYPRILYGNHGLVRTTSDFVAVLRLFALLAIPHRCM